MKYTVWFDSDIYDAACIDDIESLDMTIGEFHTIATKSLGIPPSNVGSNDDDDDVDGESDEGTTKATKTSKSFQPPKRIYFYADGKTPSSRFCAPINRLRRYYEKGEADGRNKDEYQLGSEDSPLFYIEFLSKRDEEDDKGSCIGNGRGFIQRMRLISHPRVSVLWRSFFPGGGKQKKAKKKKNELADVVAGNDAGLKAGNPSPWLQQYAKSIFAKEAREAANKRGPTYPLSTLRSFERKRKKAVLDSNEKRVEATASGPAGSKLAPRVINIWDEHVQCRLREGDGKLEQTCNYCGFERISVQRQTSVWTIHLMECEKCDMDAKRAIWKSSGSQIVHAKGLELGFS